MRQLLLILFIPAVFACSTLMSAGAAAGGAALGSLAGPGGAAIGGAAGVVAIDLIEEEDVPPPIPLEGPASTVYQIDNLINDIGWWFLAIFVLVPFVSKRFRLGTVAFLSPVPKKQVDSQEERLNKLEEYISSLEPKSRGKRRT